MTPLVFHSDVARRRYAYAQFLQDLKFCCTLHREYKGLFDLLPHFPPFDESKHRSASKALYFFIQANVDVALRNIIDKLYHELQRYDGVAALRHLQQLCSTTDMEDQLRYRQLYFSLRIKPEESIAVFNKCHLRSYNDLLVAGGSSSATEQIDHYLNAITNITNQDLRVSIGMYRRKRRDEQALGLTESSLTLLQIQSDLVNEDSRLHINQQGDQTVRTFNRPQQAQRRASAASVTSNQSPHASSSPQSPPACFGCGSTSHRLGQCPTTAPAQRRAIYDAKLRNNASSRSTVQRWRSNNNNTTATTTTTIAPVLVVLLLLLRQPRLQLVPPYDHRRTPMLSKRRLRLPSLPLLPPRQHYLQVIRKFLGSMLSTICLQCILAPLP
jgi:hypothetical protein